MREDSPSESQIDLSALVALVALRDEALRAMDKAEEHFKEQKKHFQKYDQFEIPEHLKGLGLQNVTLEDGRAIGYSEKYKVKISEANTNPCMDYIRDKGFANIIDNNIAVKFTAANNAQADEAAKLLVENGYSFTKKEGVNAARLASWVKERVEAGDDIDLQLFGAFVVNKTTVKEPKRK